ncbi:MAG: helix-turn-helix domain-containing protein [Polyangiales bacterium]
MRLDDALLRASRAIARGDPLAAISATGVRDDAHALAIRGIALSQLHEYRQAKALLAQAASAFARAGDHLHRARAFAAEAEVVAAERDVERAVEMLGEAASSLRAQGDLTNAAWAELVVARLRLFAGNVAAAHERIACAEEDVRKGGTPTVRAVVHLARAEGAMRALRADLGRRALVEARGWAERADNPVLSAEIARLEASLAAPVALLARAGERTPIDLFRVESLLAPRVMGGARFVVVDALRRRVTVDSSVAADLRTRPVLLSLLVSLARAHPVGRTPRELVLDSFGARTMNESHRARLRVEIGRLRRVLGPALGVESHQGGFRLKLPHGDELALLEPLEVGDAAVLRALLADGQAWPARSLAGALGLGARTVQRALAALCEAGEVRAMGSARARRYARIDAGSKIASQMLLLGVLTPD